MQLGARKDLADDAGFAAVRDLLLLAVVQIAKLLMIEPELMQRVLKTPVHYKMRADYEQRLAKLF